MSSMLMIFLFFRMISIFSVDAEVFPAGVNHQINNSKSSRGFPKAGVGNCFA